MRIIAAIPACGLLIGSALGVAFPDNHGGALPLWLVVAVIGAAGAVFCRRSDALAVAIAVGATAVGWLLAEDAWHHAWRSPARLVFESIARDERADLIAKGLMPPNEERASVVLDGVLREDGAVGEGGAVSLRLRLQWMGRPLASARDPAANPVDGDVLLNVSGAQAAADVGHWRRGRRIRASAQLRKPSRYLDPGVADQERVLVRRGVVLVGSIKSAALVDVVSTAGAWDETTAALRSFTRRAISASVGRWSTRAAGIVTAIVIGDRTGLDTDVERSLQEAGTYHVIAISGGNIAILAGLALSAFRLAGLLGRGAMLTAIAGLLAYASIVSGGASVDRATWMAVIYFAGRALDLRGPPLNAVAVVAGALVVVNPLTVSDPGFLLTFGASVGILVASNIRWPRQWPSIVIAAATLGLASFASELALFPVSALFFSRVTLAGLALNFVAIPMMAVAQLAGMLLIPLYAVSSLAALLVGLVAAVGAEALVRSAALVQFVPRVTWRLAAPALWAVALYYVSLAIWWWLHRRRVTVVGTSESDGARRARWAGGALTIGAAIWILAEPWAWRSSQGDGRLHVTFIDVGQGDAALVRFPRGDTMLIDTGGSPSTSFDVGDRVVGQVLRTFGLSRIDTLVLTHGDLDHVGGARAVVREFRPRQVWEGIPVPSSMAMRAVRADADRSRGWWTQTQQGDEHGIGEVKVVVHHPQPPDWERQAVRNDDSIVLELRWRDISLVFTGDAGVDVERDIAGRFKPVTHRLLKVGHHGSLTSTSIGFVEALKPEFAVISVGRGNNFGHPNPLVVGRLAEAGAEIYRTDRDGAIEFVSDGFSSTIRTFAIPATDRR